jgi:hypothetical protein
MKPRLQPKPKVRVQTSIKLTIAGAAFAVLVAVGFLVYYNFGTSKDSIANKETQLSDFNWRKKLSFEKDLLKGGEQLVNFPLLVSITDLDLRNVGNGGKVLSTKGYDIRFTKADGTSILPSQIERYNPATGEVTAWVLLDTLSPKSSAELYLYYSSAIQRSELPNVLWTDEYLGVWHLNSDLNANNDRKLKSTTLGTTEAVGKIGMARMFDAKRKDCASFPYLETIDLKGGFSFTAWVYLNESGREQIILSNQGDRPGGYRLFVNKDGRVSADFITSAGKRLGIENSNNSGEKLELKKWHYVAVVYTPKLNRLETFIDGISDRMATLIESPLQTSSALQIGRDQFETETYFNGMLDEVRIAAKPLSQAWLATEFYNQINPKQLFVLGNAEELSMDAAAIDRNKDALTASNAEELQKQESDNRLQAKKFPSTGNSPSMVSYSAEVMKVRMDNIRRISGKNSN